MLNEEHTGDLLEMDKYSAIWSILLKLASSSCSLLLSRVAMSASSLLLMQRVMRLTTLLSSAGNTVSFLWLRSRFSVASMAASFLESAFPIH